MRQEHNVGPLLQRRHKRNKNFPMTPCRGKASFHDKLAHSHHHVLDAQNLQHLRQMIPVALQSAKIIKQKIRKIKRMNLNPVDGLNVIKNIRSSQISLPFRHCSSQDPPLQVPTLMQSQNVEFSSPNLALPAFSLSKRFHSALVHWGKHWARRRV